MARRSRKRFEVEATHRRYGKVLANRTEDRLVAAFMNIAQRAAREPEKYVLCSQQNFHPWQRKVLKGLGVHTIVDRTIPPYRWYLVDRAHLDEWLASDDKDQHLAESA